MHKWSKTSPHSLFSCLESERLPEHYPIDLDSRINHTEDEGA